jgi:hypothetical protein
MGIEPETANKRIQATTHANSSFRSSEQQLRWTLGLLAPPREYPLVRRSFGDSLETDIDDGPEVDSCGVIFGLTTAPCALARCGAPVWCHRFFGAGPRTHQ